MAAEAKRRGRAVQQQQQQASGAEAGEGEEQEKELDFTKFGMLHMLEGASSLGILAQLPPEWMLVGGPVLPCCVWTNAVMELDPGA